MPNKRARSDENSFLVIVIMLIVVFAPVALAHMIAIAAE